MNPLRAWNTFWFGPVSARPLGLFRVVFGLIFLANLAFLAFDIDYWFSDIGLLQGNEAREIAGPLRLSPLQWIQDPLSVRLFFGATALIACSFTLGWHTRTSGILLYLAMLSIHHRNLLTASGADCLVMVMTFYLMLSPCGAAFSLDALRVARRRGTLAEPLILPWSYRLLQIQLCVIYFTTAAFKCNGATWLNGTALHFVVNNTEVGRPFLVGLAQYPLVINIMTHGAILLEFILAFFLWFRATRRWAILAGISLHGGIMLMVNIPIFGEMMVACYLTFLSPDEVDSLLSRLNPRTWLARFRRTERSLSIPWRYDSPVGVPAPHRHEGAREHEPVALPSGH